MADEPNVLYYGDNLDILRRYVEKESVDLIYLDPPFKSNQDYNVLFAERDGTQAAAQIKAFEDTWHWDRSAAEAFEDVIREGDKVAQVMIAFRTFLGENDMLAYLAMMAPRLVELRRVLKPTGSIYLHCDPTASHYLKMLLDAVFGPVNFRSEIVWRRTNAHNKMTRQFGPIHDTILFYSKTDKFRFHPGFRPYTKAYIEDRFTRTDARGRYQTNYLTGPGVRHGDSGKPWRGFNPTRAGRHWAIPASLRSFLPNTGIGMGTVEMLEVLYEKDLVVFPKKTGGQPMYKQYIGPGVLYQDIWAYQPNTRGVLFGTDECIDEDVKYLESEDEKLGFETQKPFGILARILRTSTTEGDLVLDPFCGCGTTIEAAQRMNRRWLGIDITHLAISLIRRRLLDAFGKGITKTYQVIGEPVSVSDAEELAKTDQYQFQWWALGLVGARPVERKKGADKGIDGRIYFHDEPKGPTKQIVISVKAGKLHAHYVRDIRGVMEREKAEIGVLISMDEPTKPMRTEAATAGFYKSPYGKRYPRLQLLTIGELLAGKDIEYPPSSHKKDVTFKEAPKAKAQGMERLPFGGGKKE